MVLNQVTKLVAESSKYPKYIKHGSATNRVAVKNKWQDANCTSTSVSPLSETLCQVTDGPLLILSGKLAVHVNLASFPFSEHLLAASIVTT